jgi:signal transduction histidine kinase
MRLVPRWLSGQVALLAAGFAVLIIVSAATAWLINDARENYAQITETLETQYRLVDLQLQLRNAETNQRGFLINDDPEFQRRYENFAGRIEPAFQALKDLPNATPAQRRVFEAIAPLVMAKLDEMRRVTALRSAGRVDEAATLFQSNQGRALMSAISAEVEKLKRDEERLLKEYTRDARQSEWMLLIITIIGAILIVLLAAASVALVRRSTSALRDAQRELKDANEGLEDRISERTTDLQEANEELQRFAYIVSHDLRSPLVNIMGFTAELETLRDHALAQQQGGGAASSGAPADADSARQDFDEALGFIKSSIAKMDRLINAILRLSRAGRREFTREQVDLAELFQSIVEAVAHQADAAGATITVGKVPAVISDRLALEQIFSNLIDNAIKYLREDSEGRISVTSEETSRRVSIQIADNGRGIDSQDRERVFDLFRRAGTQDRPGEGIGLAHVRTLVRRVGGTIKLESTPGEGSTFTVTLPKIWAGINPKGAA